ncbi:MAG: hypothetical protein EOP06_06370 [Proteobacteria bacterium]|nr:MAG: hypothetical protein EOP06_06370 [Pseudomonadota bacterium]
MKALSVQERAEVKRKRELENDYALRSEGKASPVPNVSAALTLEQHGDRVDEIDLMKAFQLRFDFAIKNAEYFESDITVGIALYGENGTRICGANTQDKALELNQVHFLNRKHSDVLFKFDSGIPFLQAGSYRLILGMHDKRLTRTILYHDFGSVKFVNSAFALNSDHDLIQIGSYLSEITLNS